jgi:hypothetical protein
MPASEEIAMADPEDRMQPEGAPPDGRPRRPPPIIEGEAVEITDGSASGARPSGAGLLLSRLSTFVPSRRVVAAAAAGILAATVGAVSWIYLSSDSGSAPQQSAARWESAPAGDVAGRATSAVGAETVARMPPAAPERTAGSKASDGGSDDGRARDTRELEGRLQGQLLERFAAVDAALAALTDRVAALDRMVRDSTAAARAAAERTERTARLLDEAKKSGDEHDAAQQLDRGALDDLAGRIKTLESRQMTIRQIQERLDHLASATGSPDKAVRAAVAASALRNAVERDGRPFAAELAAARALGLDEGALAALEPFAAAGLPKRNELFRNLSALLPELRQAAAPPTQDLGYLDRMQASAVRMLNIRPVKDEPGDDPATVLSRIEFKMVQLDIDGIIAELDKLPAKAKDAAQPWRTRALARRAAVEAARQLATASLARLGEPAAGGSPGGSWPR